MTVRISHRQLLAVFTGNVAVLAALGQPAAAAGFAAAVAAAFWTVAPVALVLRGQVPSAGTDRARRARLRLSLALLSGEYLLATLAWVTGFVHAVPAGHIPPGWGPWLLLALTVPVAAAALVTAVLAATVGERAGHLSGTGTRARATVASGRAGLSLSAWAPQDPAGTPPTH